MTRQKAASLAELSVLAGVSISTVSRSLADSPLVAKTTRDRIKQLARDHDFQINVAARNFRLGRTGAVGVVLPLGHETEQHLTDPFFMSLIASLADTLADRHYDLLLSRVIPSNDRWLQAFVDSGKVDGVIIVGQSNQIDAIEQVSATYDPLVVWGASVSGYSQLTVGSDNFEGGRMAAHHLLSTGRKTLTFLGNPDVPEFEARFAGFNHAIAQEHAPPGFVVPTHVTPDAAYATIRDYMRDHPAPDGIFAASDVIALSALRAIADHGLRVPEDIAVIGYDDAFIASQTTPSLTTIRQDVALGARMMIDLLFQRMAGEDTASISLPPTLVLRASA
ncbi:LacI family transcriptional regulator [Sphingomonas panacis]|uniref:LacI family transcriptional regulator n=1 Tax=Sphingomonas panacis TaxID=1560345 RepID=A0A1B3Z6T0_9SPHN|nr:substrate-binding domain-containing protein [Sphingomonas panacis]AOH83130.1 LacI family transcriptional regulator [Sphingomonas panacis]